MCQHVVGPRDTGRTNRLLPSAGRGQQAPPRLSPPTAEQRPCSCLVNRRLTEDEEDAHREEGHGEHQAPDPQGLVICRGNGEQWEKGKDRERCLCLTGWAVPPPPPPPGAPSPLTIMKRVLFLLLLVGCKSKPAWSGGDSLPPGLPPAKGSGQPGLSAEGPGQQAGRPLAEGRTWEPGSEVLHSTAVTVLLVCHPSSLQMRKLRHRVNTGRAQGQRLRTPQVPGKHLQGW